MNQSSHSITKDLVLIGGGHSHAIALRKFGMKPLPGIRLTLISNVSHTPYSGMLPGYVANHYKFDECHIDLRRLSQFAQAQLFIDTATGLDLKNNQVLCANHPPVEFDLLSIDIGSTPATLTVPGAVKHAIAAKPISQFLAQWDQLIEDVTQTPQRPLCLGIVGGGAGGVELALAAQAHLHQLYRNAKQPLTNLSIHLFQRGKEILPRRNAWVRRQVRELLVQRGVQLHLEETVSEVQPGLIQCESGLTVACDRIFWVTQASAAPWLQASGLATDANGFVMVNDKLQSVSHPQVFAAGDVASMVHHPRPKAGVFAVRHGKPLFQNLNQALLNQPLRPFIPQKEFLTIIGTGDGKAIASRGALGFGPLPLLWWWKDRIDRKFMDQFENLPEMNEGKEKSSDRAVTGSWLWATDKIQATSTQQKANKGQGSTQHTKPQTQDVMRCAGCGSKVGSSILQRVLQRIRQEQPDLPNQNDILIGLDAPDDAAVVRVPVGQVMVHTVDYFPALINDPFIFGQISTNHCLSDIFAMGAVPQSGLAIAVIPYSLEAKLEGTLYQLLSGAVKALHHAKTPLVGGHTTEGAELAFGLSCNGIAYPDELLRKKGMQPGQVLILTKALGTGALFAADMRRQAKGRWIEAAIQSMLLSNQAAAICFKQHQVKACTDITGFGLLGHVIEMIQASPVAVELDLAAIPVLPGVRAILEQGIISSLHPQNLQASEHIQNLSQVSDRPNYPLLFDPQTSGGLLAAVPAHQANDCLTSLQAAGYEDSQIIGQVTPLSKGKKPVTIK